MSGDFFEQYGLKVESATDITIGDQYPIYGMITKVTENKDGDVLIEVNHNITLRCLITDSTSIEVLRRRSFDVGIFVARLTSIDPLEGDCTTIVFGKDNTASV